MVVHRFLMVGSLPGTFASLYGYPLSRPFVPAILWEAFIGDYNGLVATADGVFPVWNDLRSGAPSVFTARGLLSP